MAAKRWLAATWAEIVDTVEAAAATAMMAGRGRRGSIRPYQVKFLFLDLFKNVFYKWTLKLTLFRNRSFSQPYIFWCHRSIARCHAP